MIWFSVALMLFGAAGIIVALFGSNFNTGFHAAWVPWVGLLGIAASLVGFGMGVYIGTRYLVGLL